MGLCRYWRFGYSTLSFFSIRSVLVVKRAVDEWMQRTSGLWQKVQALGGAGYGS
jgi:hypothetical protein